MRGRRLIKIASPVEKSDTELRRLVEFHKYDEPAL